MVGAMQRMALVTAGVFLLVFLQLTGCGRTEPAKPRLSQAAENRIRGQVFMAENAQQPGVTVLPSGLQYRVILVGTGPVPTSLDRVKVHYRGMFTDRKEFESSRDRDPAPVEFQVGGVVRGWQEALQLMPAGSVWEIYVPSNMAYGLDNAPVKIGPNRTLVFEIELIGVVGK